MSAKLTQLPRELNKNAANSKCASKSDEIFLSDTLEMRYAFYHAHHALHSPVAPRPRPNAVTAVCAFVHLCGYLSVPPRIRIDAGRRMI